MTELTIADWLPPALRDAPDEPPDAPRLLDALLGAIDGQRELLEADIDQVWEDFFVDSCADWAVPYIGSLLGLPSDAERLEVAYAIALRRRKGTPAALEDFAEVVTGWTARAIEGWQVTVWAQRLRHPPPLRFSTFDLRDGSRFRVGTPFERSRRSVSPSGRWSPRAATAVVWPWRVRTYHEIEASPLPEPNRFALHPLGAEAPLYLRPRPLRLKSDFEPDALRARTQNELDAPVRATYRLFEALAGENQITYGANWRIKPEHPLADQSTPGEPTLLSLTVGGAAVAWSKLRFGSLPPGAAAPAPPAAGQVVVDIARGSVELGSSFVGAGAVRATWHRPVPGSLGPLGSRADSDPSASVVVRVNPALPVAPGLVHTLTAAFTAAATAVAAPGFQPADPGHPDVEIRLETSDRLAAPAQGALPAGLRWRIVAPVLSTPTIVGDLALDLDGCVELEGFQLTGNIQLGPALRGVILRNLTMDPVAGKMVVVDPKAWGLALRAERCLLGAIQADLAAAPIDLADCVVDGLGERLRSCGGPAGGALRDAVAHNATFDPALRAAGVTFVGEVHLEAGDAVNCVFTDGIEVVQQQEGCLRHCYLGPDLSSPPSHPATYRCGPFPPPAFVSRGFEAAAYYTLELAPAHPLLSAASDGGEVGAYHHARRASRLGRLEQRIHEFVPLGLRPGLALATWEE